MRVSEVLFFVLIPLLTILLLLFHRKRSTAIMSTTTATTTITRRNTKYRYDAVICLGGGLDDQGQPHPFVSERIRTASLLSNDTQYFVLSSRGTTHKPPPTDAVGFPLDESVVSARSLLELLPDLPKSSVLLDRWSLDTIGNAWFALVNFVEPLEMTHVCVVTSKFHMPRSESIFRHVFSLSSHKIDVTFLESADLGMEHSLLEMREDRESASLQNWLKTAERCPTKQKLAKFLFQEHGAYNGNSVALEKTDDASDEVKKSY
jgi:uncharacterized SAM-binding protein YcdF (DUF218 family)